MSRETFRSTQLVVYDDVLPPERFKELFRYLNSVDYASVHARGWRKVWRLHDGNPLTGRAAWYYAQPPESGASDELRYPTNTAVDPLVSWIASHAAEVEQIIGSATDGWTRFSFAPWIYPRGSGLSLHKDGALYTGAFTYFAHSTWRLHWGGHLLVLDPRTASLTGAAHEMWPPFLDDADEASRVFEPGFALAVLPKPNRMVFVSPAAQHLLTRVDDNAGQCARLSVAGFFHKQGAG